MIAADPFALFGMTAGVGTEGGRWNGPACAGPSANRCCFLVMPFFSFVRPVCPGLAEHHQAGVSARRSRVDGCGDLFQKPSRFVGECLIGSGHVDGNDRAAVLCRLPDGPADGGRVALHEDSGAGLGHPGREGGGDVRRRCLLDEASEVERSTRFGPVPDRPRPPNGCTPTTVPMTFRFT